MERYYKGVLVIYLTIGLEFLKSGWGKISAGKFVDSLSSTLNFFSSKNPNVWYKDFLNTIAIPNAQILGNLIMWGEVLSGLAISASTLFLLFNKNNKNVQKILVLGLIGGAFLNFNFYFAAGWISPSTESVNLLMFVIEAIGVVIFSKSASKK